MLRKTGVYEAKASPWRDLLHPLTIRTRQRLWLKRDMCEANEEVLRRPYYRYVAEKRAKAGHQSDVEEAAAFRASLRSTSEAGPQLEEMAVRAKAFAEGSRLKPNYSESIVSMPPHQMSRTTTK